MGSQLHVVRAGTGPRVFLVHGSASDHTTWSIQLASPLRERFSLVAYDRRMLDTVEANADDLAELVGSEPAIVCGSSFGAVIALDYARRYGARGLVLIEPPMAPADDVPAASVAFFAEFDRIARERGGEAAAEYFLRTVLGDAAFERIPKRFQDRAKAKSAEIRADSVALVAYRPRYAELSKLRVPTLLLGGDRSAPYFRATLDALERALPETRRHLIEGAGHMLHADAPRKFAELLTDFADSLPA